MYTRTTEKCAKRDCLTCITFLHWIVHNLNKMSCNEMFMLLFRPLDVLDELTENNLCESY